MLMANSDLTPPTFEQAFADLEDTVTKLESGELALEEAVALYERGQRLAQLCAKMLDAAELRIKQIEDNGTLSPLD
ncbi:MAG: exodeoxyribonuclease VII small subunit [Anaerolineae bacterium]|nr:exodeoxyribonuclease VII small subunit [Anaerolineae bacterium]